MDRQASVHVVAVLAVVCILESVDFFTSTTSAGILLRALITIWLKKCSVSVGHNRDALSKWMDQSISVSVWTPVGPWNRVLSLGRIPR